MNRQPKNQANKTVFNWRKFKSMGSLGALGFIMLFQYQNCAPASGAKSVAASKDAAGVVTTIDDVNASAAVQFPQAKVQVPTSDQPTLLSGSCSLSQSQSVLGWKVNDAQGNEMETGFAVCAQGAFQVEMAPSSEMDCNQSYTVTAQLGKGQAGEVEVERDCSTGAVASAGN